MSYLWLGLLAGLAASPHCAGMCGPFPLHICRSQAPGRPLARQLLFLLGKTFSYVFLGALAGFFGHLLHSRLFASSQNLLAYLLGGAMIVLGLAMLDLLPRPRISTDRQRVGALFQGLLGGFFSSPGPLASFLLGIASGFLPCAVPLALLAVAAASHSVPTGMLTMAGLGLGTAPVLLAIGLSATLFDLRLRRISLRGAALIVILLGVMTLLRPTGLLHHVLPGGHHSAHAAHSH